MFKGWDLIFKLVNSQYSKLKCSFQGLIALRRDEGEEFPTEVLHLEGGHPAACWGRVLGEAQSRRGLLDKDPATITAFTATQRKSVLKLLVPKNSSDRLVHDVSLEVMVSVVHPEKYSYFDICLII